jgi:hypothetical protein
MHFYLLDIADAFYFLFFFAWMHSVIVSQNDLIHPGDSYIYGEVFLMLPSPQKPLLIGLKSVLIS